eukprot:6449076-Pyramimonas_sp.AAC.1
MVCCAVHEGHKRPKRGVTDVANVGVGGGWEGAHHALRAARVAEDLRERDVARVAHVVLEVLPAGGVGQPRDDHAVLCPPRHAAAHAAAVPAPAPARASPETNTNKLMNTQIPKE